MAEVTLPEDKELALEEHLTELRNRLVVVLAAVAVFSCIIFIFTGDIIQFIKKDMLPAGAKLIALNPLEYLYTRFMLSIVGAVIICVPLIVYEIFKFMKPGLYPSERTFFIKVVPASMLLFILGAAFSYIVLIPFSIKYLISYAEGVAVPMLVLSRFISFLSFMLLSLGLIFQLPLVTSFLVRAELIKKSDLKEKRKYVYAILFLIAFALAPDPTPVTPLVILVTLGIVYEISIIFAGYLL
ncbi:MAG: twin-arginine translocase subunit TatC [Methanobacteriota archaeon]